MEEELKASEIQQINKPKERKPKESDVHECVYDKDEKSIVMDGNKLYILVF